MVFQYITINNSFIKIDHLAPIMIKYLFTALIFIAIAFFSINANFKDSKAEAAPSDTYQQLCAQCHGAGFEGGNAQSLIDGIWQFGNGRSHMFRNIKFGIQHLGMPSFEASLTDDQIYGVVDYLFEMEEQKGVSAPAIPDSTEAMDYKMSVQVFAEDLEIPWSIDWIDRETALITERPGRLRIVKNGKMLESPVQGTPEVLHEGQGGLMDVAVDPKYDENGWVYLAYSHVLDEEGEGDRPPAMTRIVRGRLENNNWTNQEVVFEAPHELYRTTRHHYGCRIVFDPQGYMYFSIGDRGASEHAQDVTRPNGKIHRIYPDGSIPDDNPFVHQENAIPSIFTFGNRNAQGLAVHPVTGQVWETEHGPFGGDELNMLVGGRNYGWPVITYGKNYNGTVITEQKRKVGMEQPSLYWRPSIAVCGLDFYHGDQFPKWNNRLLVGALKYEEVRLLNIADDRVIHEQTLIKNMGRVRDVACGPDGAIYVVLNSPDKVIKLTATKAL